VFFFLRLKLNHDSHEFILESGTLANITVILTKRERGNEEGREEDKKMSVQIRGG
jgi:hypothetical protein